MAVVEKVTQLGDRIMYPYRRGGESVEVKVIQIDCLDPLCFHIRYPNGERRRIRGNRAAPFQA